MPERMVAELAEVACGVPSGSLGWWWGAMRFFWVAAMRFLWVAAMRFSWVVVGCHAVLLGGCHAVLVGGYHAVLLGGGGVPYGSSGWQRHKNKKKTDTVLVVSNALIQNKLIASPPTCYS